MSQRATRGCVLAVLTLALVLRIAAANYWHRTAAQDGPLFRLGDSHSYWILASELARGLPYQYGSPDASIFRAPVYPLVLAPCTLIADEQTAVWVARMVGCVLGTIAVGMTMLLASRISGNAAMLSTGVLAAAYPGAIGMSIVILSEAIFCPLMLIYLFMWQVAWESDSIRRGIVLGVGAGCIGGLAILARPSWLLFAPLLFAIGMLLGPQRGKHAALFGGTILGTVLVMTPWWIRNASITGEFVLTTLQVGPSLYDGLHAGATGGSDEGMAFMAQFAEEQRIADTASGKLRSTFEFRLNRRAQLASIEWVTEHPTEVALLAWRKFLRTWSLWPNGEDIGSGTLRLALTVGCFSILTLACMGSFRQRTRHIETGVWSVNFYWLPAVYFTLLHMVFVGSIRYREPAVLVLTVLAGLGLASVWVKVRAQGSASNERTAI
jgi:hypothetical protein